MEHNLRSLGVTDPDQLAHAAEIDRASAIGSCCEQKISERTAQSILMVLRARLSNAVREELVAKNVAGLVRVSKPRKNRKVKPWSVDEARHFLENASAADDPLYAAYVLILVLGLRKGEVLGLTWELVNLDAGELFVGEQLQRVGRRLLRRETKTESSEAPLPLPGICVAGQGQESPAGPRPAGPARPGNGEQPVGWISVMLAEGSRPARQYARIAGAQWTHPDPRGS